MFSVADRKFKCNFSHNVIMSVNNAFRVILDDSRAMLQIVASLTDDSRGSIYDHNMFTVQATPG